MAENEGNSGATRTITAAEEPPVPLSSGVTGAAGPTDRPGEELASSGGGQTLQAEPAGSGAHLAGVLEPSAMVGTEFTDLSTTTIIYLQPDGTLLEGGSGLTAEEQQAVLNQLSKHQILQVSDTEAAQLLQQTQLVETFPVQKTVLDPSQLQQVIDQVTKSQNQAQIPQQDLKPPRLNNNASQQLKTVAQHVAMQFSSVQSEPVKLQIEVPPKQEGGVSPQQKGVAVSHPQLKLAASGGLSNAQIFHIQPVVNQGQQILLQQNPGDPPIQLLLQSSTPVVGSLLPLVHKLTGQATLAGATSSPAPKPASSSIRVPAASPVKVSNNKTPPPAASKTISVPLISLPCNGMDTSPSKSPVKPPAVPVQPSSAAATPQAVKVSTPSAVRERDREKERKVKKKEKKAVKVQTRSGRVSRPPKYKAKDYKFIKTEDLADSHQSDSDDYSDMSEEEEQGENARKNNPGSSGTSTLTYSHKSRCHHCQTCDKSYIGPGGLNRHYKLNPTHAEPPLSGSAPTALKDEDRLEATAAGREADETDKLPVAATNTAERVPAASGLRGLRNRGPGRPRGRGRRRGGGRGQFLGPGTAGFGSRPAHRGRHQRSGGVPLTADQQGKRRRDRLQELVEQCEAEELTDVVLPRLTKVLSLWELLLAKVDCRSPTCASFPDIYREFESLQAHVRQAAQEYITGPQSGDKPVEVRNIEVARSLGILDEVNRMKVVPGASPASNLTNKNVRYMGNSKMLPPSKRFKMENSITDEQTGGGVTVSSVSPLKPCSVSVSPLVISGGSKLQTTSADSTWSPSGADSAQTASSQASPLATPMEVQEEGSISSDWDADAADQTTGLQSALGSGSESTAKTSESSLNQAAASSEPRQGDAPQSEPCEAKELQEGQEIYIQAEQLTVQLAEPGSDGIVIVNGPDGTTMHIQTPEGVPLEAVQALLGIEASDGDKASP